MLLAGNGQMDAARAKRRAAPIHVYVGHNGMGKSLTAIFDTLPTLEAGRPVLSTVRLLDYTEPRPCEGWRSDVVGWRHLGRREYRPVFERVDCDDLGHGDDGHLQAHPLWVPFTDWKQLLEWLFGDIVMDEVTGVADAQEWASVPSQVLVKIPQMRRHDVAVRVTGIAWMNITKRIRQIALAVTRCVATMPASAKSEFGRGRIYRPRRMVSQTTYDVKTLPLDDPSEAAYASARRLARGRLWVPDSVARNAYDTYDQVLTVGTVSDSGRCAYCGGNRRVAECACPDYVHDRAERRSAHRPPAAEHGRRSDGRHASGSPTLLRNGSDLAVAR
jgi:hypothetical protein